MRIRRSQPTKDFVQVPNATVRDVRLSHMARGILVELISRPDGWEATADDMWRASVAAHGKDSPGRRMFRAAFAELKEQGYLTAGSELLTAGRHATILTLTDVPHGGMPVRPAETNKTAGHSDVPHAGTSVRPGETDKAAGGTGVPHAGTSEATADVPYAGTSVRPAEMDVLAGHSDVPPSGTSVPPAQTDLFAGHSDVPHAGTSKEEDGEKNTGLKNTSSSSASGPAKAAAGAPKKDHHLEAFGAFWLTYPKRRDKEAAKKAWIAAIERGAEPKRMVDAAQSYARERAGEDPKFTKYPATWLNKGCYDDEPDPQPGRPGLRAVSGDYQPWTNPTDQSAYFESL